MNSVRPRIHFRTSALISDCILFLSFFFVTWYAATTACNYRYPGFWRNVPVEGYTTWFLSDTPSYPGKFCERILSLCAPGFAGALQAAVILTVLAFILTLLSGRLLEKFGVTYGYGWKYVPAMILLIQFYYMVNALTSVISVIIALSFALVYLRADVQKLPCRFLLFAVLSVAVIVAAAEAFLIFSLLCIIFEIRFRHARVSAFFPAAAGAFLPAAATFLFFPQSPVAETYRLLLPPLPSSLSFIGVLPLTFWLFFPCMAFFAYIDKPTGRCTGLFYLPIGRGTLYGTFRGILLSVMIITLTGAALLLVRDPLTTARPNAVLNAAALSRNWDLLLEQAGRMPKRYLSDARIHIINRALYHKGRLLDDLFTFPQGNNTLLPYPFSGSRKTLNPSERFWTAVWAGWTYCELGLVNVAEHCALEASSQFYYPEGLKLLSQIYAIKDMPDACRTCLMALCKDPAYRQWARQRLKNIDSGPASLSLPDIRSLRRNMLRRNFIMTGRPPLAALLRENPCNRIAFEYQIASLLVRREIDSLNGYVAGLRILGYEKIPRLFEEALLLYAFLSDRTPELYGYAPSSEAMASLERFCAVLYSKHNGRVKDAYRDLAGPFGSSFFFYYFCGSSKAAASDGKQ